MYVCLYTWWRSSAALLLKLLGCIRKHASHASGIFLSSAMKERSSWRKHASSVVSLQLLQRLGHHLPLRRSVQLLDQGIQLSWNALAIQQELRKCVGIMVSIQRQEIIFISCVI